MIKQYFFNPTTSSFSNNISHKREAKLMSYLNLGCGAHYHSHWTNIDMVSTGEDVIGHDLTQGIPFPDNSFEVVYHSHVLEHLPKREAESFLKECYRVLRPQGLLRVVVPDLEQVARTYLMALEKASQGSYEWGCNYEWIMLEMYDMTVRNDSGGEMAKYLVRENIAEEFVKQRSGTSIQNWRERLLKQKEQRESELTRYTKSEILFKEIYRFLRYPGNIREALIKALLGKYYRPFQIGRLRQSGELHQWMYDRYSLALSLEKCGFKNIAQRSAHESSLLNWTSFNLDTESDGYVYKPDSLYMEAIKPAS